jgi:hypothetical protein
MFRHDHQKSPYQCHVIAGYSGNARPSFPTEGAIVVPCGFGLYSRRFATDTDAGGRRHARWLNMMYPRLYLARHLLREDGVIFISIDDNEQANLKALCDLVVRNEILCVLAIVRGISGFPQVCHAQTRATKAVSCLLHPTAQTLALPAVACKTA